MDRVKRLKDAAQRLSAICDDAIGRLEASEAR